MIKILCTDIFALKAFKILSMPPPERGLNGGFMKEMRDLLLFHWNVRMISLPSGWAQIFIDDPLVNFMVLEIVWIFDIIAQLNPFNSTPPHLRYLPRYLHEKLQNFKNAKTKLSKCRWTSLRDGEEWRELTWDNIIRLQCGKVNVEEYNAWINIGKKVF